MAAPLIIAAVLPSDSQLADRLAETCRTLGLSLSLQQAQATPAPGPLAAVVVADLATAYADDLAQWFASARTPLVVICRDEPWSEALHALAAGGAQLVARAGLTVSQLRLALLAAGAVEDGKRVSSIAEDVPVMLWATDAHGHCFYLNATWERFSGCHAEDGLGHGWLDCVHPDDRANAGTEFDRALAGQQPMSFEYRMRRYDGSYRRVLDSGEPRFDRLGRLVGYVGAVLDISDRHRVEAALLDTVDRLTLAQRAARAGTFDRPLTEPERPAVVSDEYRVLYGFGREDAVTYNAWLQRLHPDDRDRMQHLADRVCAQGGEYDVSFRIRHPVHGDRWLHSVGKVIPGVTGQPERLTGITFDITAQQTTLLSLERSQKDARQRLTELESIYRHAPVGLCQLDRDLRYVRINERLAEINGVAVADHLGRHVREVVPTLMPTIDAVTQRILSTGQAVIDHEFEGETPAQPGRRRAWRESWYPVHADDEITGFGVVVEEITEQRDATALLSRSEGIHRRLTEAGLFGAVFSDAEGNVVSANDEWRRMTGLSTGSAASAGTAWTANVAVAHRPRAAAAQSTARDGGDAGFLETILEGPNGRRTPVLMRTLRVAETPPLCVTIATDLTRIRAAEAAVQASEAQLQFALNCAHAGVWQWDLDSGELHWTEGIYRLCGFDPRQPTPSVDEWLARVHPDDLPSIQVAVDDVVAGRSDVLRMEFRFRPAPDSERWLSTVGRVERDDRGNALRLSGINLDVTDRHRAEEAELVATRRLALAHQQLEQSFALLETMFDQAPIGMAFLDTELRYVRVNSTLAALNRLPVDAHIGHSVADVLPTIWPHVAPLLNRVLIERRALPQVEVRAPVPGRDSDDSEGWWLAGYYPVLVRGELIGIGIAAIDVTDRKHAEIVMREADQRKDEFLATLAHELRNPLAPIRNAAHAMRVLGSDGPMKDMVAIIERQVSHMVRLIDDLLDVSRISRGKIELKRERFDVADAVSTAIETVRPALRDKRLALSDNGLDRPAFVNGDRVRLAQAIGNLLTNAAKFTPSDGRIDITVTEHEHALLSGQGDDRAAVCITVRDTGVGIARDQLATIFGMFTQLDAARDAGAGGLGIGLWLVQQLVQLHGGEVTADSDGLGQGARFTICLPRQAGPELVAADAGSADDLAGPWPSGRRVLVVDDNADNATTLAMLLEMAGNAVKSVSDGRSAVQVAEGFRPEVVLLDLGLPDVDGYSVCRSLRATPWGRAATIIAVTGWGQEADRQRSREAGFDHHLTKPVDLAVLRRLI